MPGLKKPAGQRSHTLCKTDGRRQQNVILDNSAVEITAPSLKHNFFVIVILET